MSPNKKINILVPKQSNNPVIEANSLISELKFREDALLLLATISDESSYHKGSHTYILLELALSINILAGSPLDCNDLFSGVCLHDIALSTIPTILNKKEKLSEEEMEKIKRHPIDGAKISRALSKSDGAALVVLQHHERVDGSGYPYGLKGDQISDEGKLISIVDSFHALIEKFPKDKKTYLRAISEINACIGTRYDERWVKLFNRCVREYWLTEYKDTDHLSTAVIFKEKDTQ